MIFGKKKPSAGMSIRQLHALDKKPLKYVTEREAETYREIKIGGEGGINVVGDEFLIVCTGVNVIRCRLSEVSVAELMNRSGITVKGYDLDAGKERSVIAYYSDGTVSTDSFAKR